MEGLPFLCACGFHIRLLFGPNPTPSGHWPLHTGLGAVPTRPLASRASWPSAGSFGAVNPVMTDVRWRCRRSPTRGCVGEVGEAVLKKAPGVVKTDKQRGVAPANKAREWVEPSRRRSEPDQRDAPTGRTWPSRAADIRPPIAAPCLREDDEVVRRRRRDAAPHSTEADHVCTKHHHPRAALVH
jgi:hypothetical protein